MTALDIIQEHSFARVPKTRLLKLSLDALIKRIDPHGGVLSEAHQQVFQDQLQGNFKGIGIIFKENKKGLYIEDILKNSPADIAGLKVGDYIHQLNDSPVKDLSFEDLVFFLRSESGPINLQIKRKGRLIKKIVQRRLIPLNEVTWSKDEHIAWIKIPSFISLKGSGEIRKILNDIHKTPSLKGLIIDLRGNAGGLLDAGIEFCNLFLDGKVITTVRGKDPKDIKEYVASNGELFRGLPLILLVDQQTASAAEVVVGCLKDHHRALIVGKKTYGKASIQSIFSLNPDFLIQLTTHRYYTPKGQNIDQHGIVPDVIISHNEEKEFEERSPSKDAFYMKAKTLIQELNVNGQTIENYRKYKKKST